MQVFHPDEVFAVVPSSNRREGRVLLPPSPTDSSTSLHVVRDPRELLQMQPAVSGSRQKSTGLTERSVLRNEAVEVTNGKESQEVATIASWLASLGIAMQHPELLLSSPQVVCADFQDGTLLVRVVEACENLRGLKRGGIVGVDKHPRTAAAKLGNIRRALEVLRENRSMMLDYLWSELAIRDGSSSVIRGILMHIRNAYGFHSSD
jgi:hypothetical protein